MLTAVKNQSLQLQNTPKEVNTEVPDFSGLLIKNRYKTSVLIGRGAFGSVHLAADTQSNTKVAIKFEVASVKKQVLKVEIALLKKIKSYHICTLVDGGRANWNGQVMTFMVMNLLGPSLSDLRKKQTNTSFSIHTTALIGLQMLEVFH